MTKFGRLLFTIKAECEFAMWLRRRTVAHFNQARLITMHDAAPKSDVYRYSIGGYNER